MGTVTISVDGMADVVRGLEQGVETLQFAQSSLRSALERFELDSSRTVAIGWSVRWALEELPGVRRRLAMAQELEGQKPGWAPGVVQFEESVISTLAPEVAVGLGRRAAVALRDGEGGLDAELIGVLEAHVSDPYFASGLAHGLTVAELAAVVKRLSYWRDVGEDPDAARRQYGRAVVALAQVTGTATRATGELAMPLRYAHDWVEEIAAQVDPAVNAGATGQRDHANALSLLVTSGRWDASFLTTVAGGVVDFERDTPASLRGSMWLERGLMSPRGGAGVYDAVGLQILDPVSALMAGLGKNPEAAQRFFLAGGTSAMTLAAQDVVVSARLRYLVEEREWGDDRVPGRGFGQALEAATTRLRNRQDSGRVSAQLATQAFALLGNRTGEGAHDEAGGRLTSGGWSMPEGMRGSVARMLAAYGTDVWDAISLQRFSDPEPGSGATDALADEAVLDRMTMPGSDGETLFGGGLPYGAMLDAGLLERLVQTLGEDEVHTATFLAGVAVASNLAISTGMTRTVAGNPDAGRLLITGDMSLPRIDNPIGNSAFVLGWSLQAAYSGAEKRDELAAAQAETFKSVVGMAVDLPFLSSLPSETTQWALAQITNDAIDRATQADATATIEAHKETHEDLPQAAIDNVMQQLLQSGLLTDEAYAAANAATGDDTYKPPPADAYVPGSDPLRFDLDSDAYLDWLRNDGPTTFLQDKVTNPYTSVWANL